jgi:hypothetical protein
VLPVTGLSLSVVRPTTYAVAPEESSPGIGPPLTLPDAPGDNVIWYVPLPLATPNGTAALKIVILSVGDQHGESPTPMMVPTRVAVALAVGVRR